MDDVAHGGDRVIKVGQLRETKLTDEGPPPGLYYIVEHYEPIKNYIFEWRYLVISPDIDMEDHEGQLCEATAGWLESWTVEL